MNLIPWLEAHILWSSLTFGEGPRTEGLCKHIESELDEIRAKPGDLSEWIDVLILAFDGAWRAGYSPDEICAELIHKQGVNFRRQWGPPPLENEPSFHLKNP